RRRAALARSSARIRIRQSSRLTWRVRNSSTPASKAVRRRRVERPRAINGSSTVEGFAFRIAQTRPNASCSRSTSRTIRSGGRCATATTTCSGATASSSRISEPAVSRSNHSRLSPCAVTSSVRKAVDIVAIVISAPHRTDNGHAIPRAAPRRRALASVREKSGPDGSAARPAALTARQRPCPRSRCSGAGHFETPRLRLRLLGNGHLDDSIACGRMHARCIRRVGKREAPVEAAESALAAAALDLARAFGGALTAHREHALIERDLDRSDVYARHVELQYEAILVLLDVRRRHPVGRGCGTRAAYIEFPVEYAVDLLMK